MQSEKTSELTQPPKVTRVYILDGDEGQRHSCPIPGSLEEFGWCEIDRDVSEFVQGNCDVCPVNSIESFI